MRLAVLVIHLLFFYTSWSQDNIIGLSYNINGAYISDNSTFGEKFRRFGHNAGFNYQVKYKQFYYGAEIAYCQRGFSTLTKAITDTSKQNIKLGYIDYQYNYAALPLTIAYRGKGRLFGLVGFCVIPSVLINSKTYILGYLAPTNKKSKPSSFDLGAQLELGGGLRLMEQWAVLSKINFFRGVTSLSNDTYFSGSTIRNTGISFGISVEHVISSK